MVWWSVVCHTAENKKLSLTTVAAFERILRGSSWLLVIVRIVRSLLYAKECIKQEPSRPRPWLSAKHFRVRGIPQGTHKARRAEEQVERNKHYTGDPSETTSTGACHSLNICFLIILYTGLVRRITIGSSRTCHCPTNRQTGHEPLKALKALSR